MTYPKLQQTRLSYAAGAITAFFGCLVLAGWAFNIALLKSQSPNLVSMKANTALCFMLAGAGLMLLSNPEGTRFRVRIGMSLAFIVMLIAGLTLTEYIFDWQAGIDELLFKDDPGAFGTVAPGRMAPNTALNFLLLGLGLALIDIKIGRGFFRLTELFALLTLLVSIISTVEYLIGLEFLFSFQKYTRMALHTTLIFGALSSGVLLSRPDRGLVGALRQGMITAIEQRIYAAFILSLFILIIIGAASYFNAQDSFERSRLVDRAQQARKELAGVLSTIQDIETGQRGYVITGDARFLEPYNSALHDIDQHHHKALEALIIDQDQKKRHDALDLLIEKRIEHARRVIALKKSGGTEQAAGLIKSGEGKRVMDEIRSIVSMMDAEEVRIIAVREKDELRSATRMKIAIFGGIAFALLMNVCAMVVIHRDFKRRKQAEDSLRRSEENLTVTLHSIGDGVLSVDVEQKVVRLNPVAEHLTGWTEAEARGRAVEEVFRIMNEETRMSVVVPVEEVLAKGLIKGLANHTVLISRDGTERPIADSAAPIRDRTGELLGVVLVFRDVTTERKAEKTLSRFNEELERQVRDQTAALHASEITYRRLFEAAKDGILILDAETGMVMDVNPFLTELLGFSHEAFLGKKIWELGFFKDIVVNQDNFYELQQKEYIRYDDLPLETSDGRRIEVEFVSNIYLVNHQKVIQCNIRDITERKQSEDTLRTLSSRYQAILAAVPDIIMETDANKVYQWANQSGRDFFGDDVLGKEASFYFEGEQDTYDKVQPLFNVSEITICVESWQRRKDGEKRLLGWWSRALKDAQGNVTGALSTARDITESQRAEDELRASEERYKKLIESTTNYIYSVKRKLENGKPVATSHSPGCVSTTGYTAEEYEADPYLWYRMIHEGDRQAVMERINELLAGKEPQTLEHRLVHKDGTIRWVSDTLVPKYEGGKLVAYDGLVVDVTERKKLQEAEIARLSAESANKAKSDFLANMSHELRTPLNSILGFSEILQDELFGALNEKQKECATDIYSSGKHLLSLINDILDLAKVESGKMELELSTFPLKDVLNATLCMVKEKAMKHNLKLGLESKPEADIEIEADERKLKQIMFNLLSNAVKFTPDGGSVRVSARKVHSSQFPVHGEQRSSQFTVPSSQTEKQSSAVNEYCEPSTVNRELNGDFIEISVTDTGIGIKPEDIEKLFKPFSQLESAYTKNFEGTGLGLALTKKLVELHDGKIWVESEFGKGSRFVFVIPVKQ